VTAIVGILMFGDGVRDEITSNILKTTGYPRALTFLLCVFISIIPLTKIPLNARPIVTMAEVISGLNQQTVSESETMVGRSAFFRGAMKIIIRVAIIFTFLVISIIFPAFDSIMAFMGSALCFSICVM
jgi:vesicular inhibitory amino acid transporter